MSLATVSNIGRQVNKMYEITVEIAVSSSRNLNAIFYSSTKINTFTKLCNFLDQQTYNKRIRVFGTGKLSQNDIFYLPQSIGYDGENRCYVSYFANDGDGFRILYFTIANFYVVEV